MGFLNPTQNGSIMGGGRGMSSPFVTSAYPGQGLGFTGTGDNPLNIDLSHVQQNTLSPEQLQALYPNATPEMIQYLQEKSPLRVNDPLSLIWQNHRIAYDDNGNPFAQGGSNLSPDGAGNGFTKTLNGQDIYFKPEGSFFSDFMHEGLPIAAGVIGSAFGIPGMGQLTSMLTGGSNSASSGGSNVPSSSSGAANFSPQALQQMIQSLFHGFGGMGSNAGGMF